MEDLGLAPFDTAEYLKTPEDIAGYIAAILEEWPVEAGVLARALGAVARSQGMAAIARESGLSRESLYKSLSGKRSPSLDTFLRVVDALGLRVRLAPRRRGAARRSRREAA